MTKQKNRVRVVVLEVEGDGTTVAETIAHAFRLWEIESREELRELTPDSASVDCPRCGATVGQQCRNEGGGFHVAAVHAERWDAALQKGSSRS